MHREQPQETVEEDLEDRAPRIKVLSKVRLGRRLDYPAERPRGDQCARNVDTAGVCTSVRASAGVSAERIRVGTLGTGGVGGPYA